MKRNLQVVPVIVAIVVALFVGVKIYNSCDTTQPLPSEFKTLQKRVENFKNGAYTYQLSDKITDWKFAYVLTMKTPQARALLVFDNTDTLVGVKYVATNPFWLAISLTLLSMSISFVVIFLIFVKITSIWNQVYLTILQWCRHRHKTMC